MKLNLHPKVLGKQTERFVKTNAPAILTIVGAAGVGVTAYLTGKATVKATRLIDEERIARTTAALGRGETVTEPVVLTKKEIFLKVWVLYIPAVSAGLVSAGSVLLANHINTKRLTAAVAAYTMAEKAHEEYRDKVSELTTKGKEQRVRDELAKDQVARTPMPASGLTLGPGDTAVLDALGGRYFPGSIEMVKKAQNDLNYRMLVQGSCSLSEFYDALSLPHTALSDDLGWNTDAPVDLELTSVIVGEEGNETERLKARTVMGAPIGQPVLVMDFRRRPFPGFQ